MCISVNICAFQYVQIWQIQLFFPLRVNHQYTKSRKLFHDSPVSSGIQKVWRCQRCSSFQTLFLRTLLNHYNSAHKKEINFLVKCDVESCTLKFNKYNWYYEHVRVHHNDIHSLKSIEGITRREILLNKNMSCSMKMLNSTNPRRVMIRISATLYMMIFNPKAKNLQNQNMKKRTLFLYR